MTDSRRVLLFNAWLQAALVVLVVVLANALAARWFVRLDVTGERLHSLDEASKAIVARLERPLVVTAYFTGGLSAPYADHEQRVRDKLDELAAYAGGRLAVRFVDPASDPAKVADAERFGLQRLDYTARDGDRTELRSVWMGAVMLYGDRQEVLPALTDLSTLEYDLASAIHRLTQKIEDTPTIAWTSGFGEPDLTKADGPLRTITEQLGRRYRQRIVSLGGRGGVPADIDALIVAGPHRLLSDRALWQIDQFVMRGGSVAFFVTNTRPDMRRLATGRVASGLEPLIGHYGVRVGRDLVLDRAQNGRMRFPVRQGRNVGSREINSPLLPRATDLSRTSPLTSGLAELLFPFTSTLALPEALPPGVQGEVLATTSASAGAVDGVTTIDPSQLTSVLSSEQRGPFPVLVTITGAFRSFFETRAVPAPDPTLPATDDDESAPEPAPIAEGANTRLVVAGSVDFIANNPAFMLNVVDWLVKDEALIGIRSKTATITTLAPTSPGERLAWKVAIIAVGPGILFVYGAVRAAQRRRRARREAA